MYVDVKQAGPQGSKVGLSTLNVWFHHMTGVHMTIYTITDWLGLVPIAVCLCFGVLGAIQLCKRKSLFRVDQDIILLGIYYLLVIFAYLFFEMVPINYRPILIEGILEASYPSSTTLLVLSVMPTLKFQVDRRLKNPICRKITTIFVVIFSSLMVMGRMICGVHWLTDIVGAVFLSFGLFTLYRFFVACLDEKSARSRRDSHGVS